MGVASLLLHSSQLSPPHHHPITLTTARQSHKRPINNCLRISLGPNSKHLTRPTLPARTCGVTGKRTKTHLSPSLSCSYSGANVPLLRTKLAFASFIPSLNLSRVTPLAVCKWSVIVFLAVAAGKKAVQTLLSPFFWMYFSWTWLFWPWIVAACIAAYGLYCLRKHLRGEASTFEQLAVVTSAFTWLTLVPAAHFNGFLEGWPIVFFFGYHYFFFFNSTIRKRLYGDLYPRPHDAKWDISLPNHLRVLFSAAVLVGHWLAAAEGPELHLIPGGWASAGIYALILIALFMQYHGSLYLAKYSEKVVVPSAVVQFGPFRWVRHPIYASTMLMLATYCAALRAPLSCLFITVVCVAYYNQKAKLEERLMLETFGEGYEEYMSKVKYKFIPFVY